MHQQFNTIKRKGANFLQIQDYTNPYPCDDNSFLPLFLHPGTELKILFEEKFDISDRVKPDFTVNGGLKTCFFHVSTIGQWCSP